MLRYHHDIQADLQRSNTLLVLARGLGMSTALASFVAGAVSPDTLIIGLNISRPIATHLIYPALQDALHRVNPSYVPLLLPRFLSADYTVAERTAVYAAGGFVIATSAVLVHDCLHHAIPPASVAHILVFAADAVVERSNHHFALKLLRLRNPKATIHAFSENAPALARGFHHSEKLMRNLYLSHLSLWPRFHQSVKHSLRAHLPDLIDLSIPLTPRLISLLTSLRDTIHTILADLRLATRTVDFSEIYHQTSETPDSRILVHNFDDVIRRQLDGSDARVTAKVRNFLADLTVLRTLLRDALQLNAIQFYQRLVTVRHTAAHTNNWLVRREAQRAVLAARSRVWLLRKTDTSSARLPPSEQLVDLHGIVAPAPIARPDGSHPLVTIATLEPSPKWRALRAVLREIRTDAYKAGADADVGRVLVAVREQRMVDELTAVLTQGGDAYLRDQFRATFPAAAHRARQSERQARSMRQVTMTQLMPVDTVDSAQQCKAASNPEAEASNSRRRGSRRVSRPPRARGNAVRNEDRAQEELAKHFREVKSHCSTEIEVLVWCMEWVDLQGRAHRILHEYRPAFIVLYSAEPSLVRATEVYKASYPGRPVRMYILTHDDVAEEERYRGAISREKNAFKSLIRERATMTVHVDQEGTQKDDAFIAEALLEKSKGVRGPPSQRGLGVDRDSRALVQDAKGHAVDGGKVIVDTRELRSKLPMLLYQSSLTIVPVTLEVADFVLSKDIGIERKSVPDLLGSFGSGRLFNQAEALCRHYRHPCLLIELETSRPLSLTAACGGVPSEIMATSIVSKMVLLIQQFPSLRLLWSKGPNDAAEMFATLKMNEGEPDVELASSLGVDSKEGEDSEFNAGPKALLRSLPGIDSTNLNRVMRKVRNVATLITMSKEEITELLGNVGKATLLYNFVNEQPSEALAAL